MAQKDQGVKEEPMILSGIAAYLVGGYLSAHYIWDEDVLARLTGRNWVDQNLIPLVALYLVGAGVTFVAWPLVVPAITIWRWSNK